MPEKELPGNKTADFSAVGFGKEQLGYDGIGVYGIITIGNCEIRDTRSQS